MPTDNRFSNKKNSALFGNWTSAISAELIVSDSVSITEPKVASSALYYIERRPHEAGRCVIVKHTNNSNIDILPPPFSARSRVHEYGGGCYCIYEQITADTLHDVIFFINDSDQNIYCIDGEQTLKITHCENHRFADFIYDKKRHRLIAVCEYHDGLNTHNSIVGIDVANGDVTSLVQGSDFYASPRINSRADQLCWQSWDHPNMPWDGNRLWLAEIDENGQIGNQKHIAGADDISVFQPQWSPDDILYYISDDNGWWHLYCYHEPSLSTEQLTHGDKEFGSPQWVFSQSNYAFLDDKNIICCYQCEGRTQLALLSLSDNISLSVIATVWNNFSYLTTYGKTIGFIAASEHRFPQLVSAKLVGIDKPEISHSLIKSSSNMTVSEAYLSKARTLVFSNRHQQAVYANYYPPGNPDYPNNLAEPPPMVVICHGGPTGHNSTELDPKKLFWTSRGFALLDVNYSGSTGYGRDYRLRLNKRWGELDVTDCCDAALYAVSQGLADSKKLIIRGSSAGGYTVLAALTFEQVFSAGASYYGISELSSLATDTHKFESRYLDSLIGPYPEMEELYQQRSPINYTEQLNCPVIFFQGVDDKVVPKQQAEKMFHALKSKGLPVAAQYFQGEQHGFRQAETIVQSLENELAFYRLIFSLEDKENINFSGDIQLANI